MSKKESLARQLAKWIAAHKSTTVQPYEINGWSAEQVYTYVEAWGYYWHNGEWLLNDDNESEPVAA